MPGPTLSPIERQRIAAAAKAAAEGQRVQMAAEDGRVYYTASGREYEVTTAGTLRVISALATKVMAEFQRLQEKRNGDDSSIDAA